ncbi:MAG TPA: hypothetical protein VMT58_08805 [Candidatus Binataceae bacterium]|nr:hypothetical protein [Candidatus Binataceae bacterium]
MSKSRNALKVAAFFALGSVITTLSGAFVAMGGSEGAHWNLIDWYIVVVEWPMCLIFGTNFYVFSATAFFLNAGGWFLAVLVIVMVWGKVQPPIPLRPI